MRGLKKWPESYSCYQLMIHCFSAIMKVFVHCYKLDLLQHDGAHKHLIDALC